MRSLKLLIELHVGAFLTLHNNDLTTYKNTEEKMENTQNKIEETKEAGASMVEYALIAALIAIVCIGGITALGTTASQKYSAITSGMNN